jgi:hypothetical protein
MTTRGTIRWLLVGLLAFSLVGTLALTIAQDAKGQGNGRPITERVPQSAKPMAVAELRWDQLPAAVNPGREPWVTECRLSPVDCATRNAMKQAVQRPSQPAPPSPPARGIAGASGATPEPGPLTPTLGTSFEGFTNQDNVNLTGFLIRPADPAIAVGPDHVGVIVNSVFRVYSKNGQLEPATAREASLIQWFDNVCPWGSGNCFPFDPQIVYDEHEGRWIIVAVDVWPGQTPPALIFISVSRTSDPMGNWWNYVYNASAPAGGASWCDYPKLGYDGILSTRDLDGGGFGDGTFYVSCNNFFFSGGFDAVVMWYFLKAFHYSGGNVPTPGWSAWAWHTWLDADGVTSFTIEPARTHGNSGNVEYMVNTRWANSNFVTLWRTTPGWEVAPTRAIQATLIIGSYTIPPNAEQPAACGGALLDTIDNRMYNAVWRGNMIYSGFNEACAGNACWRIVGINTATNAVVSDDTWGSVGGDAWFPAVEIDSSGNVLLVGAFSHPAGVYPSLVRGDQPSGTSDYLKAGESCITGTRWGDYFGAAVDPQEQSRIWLYGQYARDLPGISSVWDWSTWIGQVTLGIPPNKDDELGVWRPSTQQFLQDVDDNGNFGSPPDRTKGPFGSSTNIPIVGNWVGSAGSMDKIGVWSPSTRTFYLDINNNGVWDSGDRACGPFGASTDRPTIGDWDGDGKDSIGVWRPSNQLHYRDYDDNCVFSVGDKTLGPFGSSTDTPIIGNWDGTLTDASRQPEPSSKTQSLIGVEPLVVTALKLVPNPLKAGSVARFIVQGQNIESLQVEIYNLAGRRVFDSGFVAGNELVWALQNDRGHRVANGVYLYIVRVRGFNGEVIASEVKKLVVLR